MTQEKEKVLQVKDLVISFKTDRGIVHAVRGVTFDLYKGETLCIVGESGSGKSVTNKAIMGISAKNAIIEHGQILYEGEDLVRVSEEEFHRIRGKKIGMIFQDPLSALNPVMRIGKQITEATLVNKNVLKRKYSSLIANELTAYRNNKANTEYNFRQIESEIDKNKTIIEKYSLAEKKLSKLNKENNTEKEDKEYNELIKTISDLKTEFDDYKTNVQAIVDENIKKFTSRIEKYSSLTSFKDELDKQINDNNIEKAKLHLAVFENPDFLITSDNIIEELKKHNDMLKLLAESYKKEYKLCKKPLKIKFKLSKKNAKKEVSIYAKDIKKEHHQKLKELHSQYSNLTEELKKYRASLSKDKLNAIDEVVSYNKNLEKQKEKQSKKYKEINISKTTQKVSEFKELPDYKYAEFLKKEKEILDGIKVEEKDYTNKTKITKSEAKKMAIDVMREVGIPMPEKRFRQYPFEFSGGMRQRIVIAIALTANPEILICDEPTTALDVTIQSQILELINRLKKQRNLSCIFITHDLGVVANMADRVAVMYAGKIVEYGLADEVFFNPKHPYTWALLSSIPDIDSKEKLEAIPGTPPDMIYPPKGDAFALRSKYAMSIDFKYEPPFFKVSDTHYAATWLLCPGAPIVEMPQIVSTRIKNALKERSQTINEEKGD